MPVIYAWISVEQHITDYLIEHYICDRIYKKGSYTHNISIHRFHHHSIDTLSDNPCIHVMWPTVHWSAFPEDAF